jgi:ferritin-like metal-binding protein YciE
MPQKKTEKNPKEDTLHDLLLMKLRALYDVESELVKALPKMAKRATNPALRQAFEEHARQTKGHIGRLEKAFKLLDEKPKKLRSESIRGMIEDADWVMKNVQGKEAIDAGLIAAAQYVEHYEIAGYGSAQEWAELMRHDDVERLLAETREEEKQADIKLNELAMTGINRAANKEGMGM